MLAKIRLFSVVCIAAFLTVSQSAAAQGLSVSPVNPNSQDNIRLSVQTNGPDPLWYPISTTVKMTNQKISVNFANDCGPIVAINGSTRIAPFEASLGQLPSGNYEVEAFRRDCVNTSASVSLGKATFDVTVARSPEARASLYDYTDIWWTAAEPGWGISIHTKKSRLFAAWFVYGPAGEPVWYTLQGGGWGGGSAYTGYIYRANGPYFVDSFTAINVKATEVGMGRISFTSYDRATLEFTVNGVVLRKEITRTPF
jgi:hypothetical protein